MFSLDSRIGGKVGSVAAACVVLVSFPVAFFLRDHPPTAPFRLSEPMAAVVGDVAPIFNSHFASTDLDDFVHASSITELPGGDLLSVWFAGSREGAADVEIRSARFSAVNDEWGEERVLATRASTQRALGKSIRKLGNPVIALAPDNRLWLFYVSVSFGGWAASSINAQHSDDFGKTWTSPRQLVTTPFLNISTLVRAAPVFHADGSIGLPIYHEFLGKFAEYLYLSAAGDVVDKFRISYGKNSLQPTVVALDGQNAVAMLRYAGDTHHRVLASTTSDAGQTWSAPRVLDPANPNSSLAAVATANNDLLVVLNDLTDGRFRLRLMGTNRAMNTWAPGLMLDESPDPLGLPFELSRYREIIAKKFKNSCGAQRQKLLAGFLLNLDKRVCDTGGCNFEYEYPYFIRSGADGLYHLVYSWNNSFIKHVTFNDAWIEAQQ